MRMTLEQFRKRYQVVNPLDAAAKEPNKYYDPFIEREDTVLSVDE